MLIVAKKPIMLRVIMQNVVMLNVVVPLFWRHDIWSKQLLFIKHFGTTDGNCNKLYATVKVRA
jgi:hypothetical protein